MPSDLAILLVSMCLTEAPTHVHDDSQKCGKNWKQHRCSSGGRDVSKWYILMTCKWTSAVETHVAQESLYYPLDTGVSHPPCPSFLLRSVTPKAQDFSSHEAPFSGLIFCILCVPM